MWWTRMNKIKNRFWKILFYVACDLFVLVLVKMENAYIVKRWTFYFFYCYGLLSQDLTNDFGFVLHLPNHPH
jgi:hypothetical protein